MQVDGQSAGRLDGDVQAAGRRMRCKMVPGECVLTGHGYNSLRRGVEEGCEVDCGEVVEWVDVREKRTVRETCGPAVKAPTCGSRLPSRQCDRGGAKSPHL